ncbi:nuclease domain-containing protein [Ramlibacter sp. 2FC]|uniref:nuclease domain-containing protein n=1 Tax=Ramlibacter sp. 2FC TaxID=2502188 RepID=UPI0014854F7C|nr:nuclease domain-containing protein [Ramlibacter sp. 2FC]
MKETSLLYEYWCFLKIIGLLRERFDLKEQSVVQVNRLRTTVALSKGKSSAMRFVHKPTGKPLYVVYNRLFNRLPTIAQKPDNVIQFASEDKFYIFDAKYRIQFDGDYVKLYGGPGPTSDDVNTMHRYRDAIAIPHPMKPQEYKQGVVAGAVVLFPYPNEEAFRAHKFYKSINQVEIGGLPFLPGATTLVAEKIEALLSAEYPDPPTVSAPA